MLGISQMYLMVDLNTISMIYVKCYKLTFQWGIKQSAVLLHKNETFILSKVKHITSPGWMHETSART